jgi:ribbon-helix-helix CopG family protein
MAKVKATRKNPRTKSGSEITPVIADALAAEAERGYDLSKAKRRRVGRPSLAGGGASPRLSFRTTPDLYLAAQKRAKKEGRSVSDLVREAVARYVGLYGDGAEGRGCEAQPEGDPPIAVERGD